MFDTCCEVTLRLHTRLHAHTHTHTHTNTHTHTHTYTHRHTHTNTHTHTEIHARTHIHTQTQKHKYTCTHIHTRAHCASRPYKSKNTCAIRKRASAHACAQTHVCPQQSSAGLPHVSSLKMYRTKYLASLLALVLKSPSSCCTCVGRMSKSELLYATYTYTHTCFPYFCLRLAVPCSCVPGVLACMVHHQLREITQLFCRS